MQLIPVSSACFLVQKSKKDETFDKSKTLKQVSSEDKFQDEYNDKSIELSEST